MLKKSTIIAMSRGKPSFWFIVLLFLFVLLVVFFFGGGSLARGGYVKFCHNIYLWNIFWYILRTSWNIQTIIHFFFFFFTVIYFFFCHSESLMPRIFHVYDFTHCFPLLSCYSAIIGGEIPPKKNLHLTCSDQKFFYQCILIQMLEFVECPFCLNKRFRNGIHLSARPTEDVFRA